MTILVILCEDRAHANVVRHHLKKRKYKVRKLHFKVAPRGRGSGEAFVRREYVKEVIAYRSRAAYQTTGLLVALDADIQTVERVHAELDERLEAEAQQTRSGDEKIALLVPKRNVETWVVHLVDGPVDEVQDYKRHKDARRHREAGIELATRIAGSPPSDTPDSLQRAWPELKQRLPEPE
jgi:hypothetical protein